MALMPGALATAEGSAHSRDNFWSHKNIPDLGDAGNIHEKEHLGAFRRQSAQNPGPKAALAVEGNMPPLSTALCYQGAEEEGGKESVYTDAPARP
ncbi:unnamed protein product [Rangifer tarandus platyrhynchus]|uniref:Uncharacterized protein n=2 Tax=Rangifer tarandus platyrhynchus TaxID=3082113 RepID=A0ABN8XUD3_RANTA|nr:unnamed protein product [Rangifer tarandus platyrhynchus]CAI9690245.1 unnamed protein product [Rangifer tarandus platyrhynchus]